MALCLLIGKATQHFHLTLPSSKSDTLRGISNRSYDYDLEDNLLSAGGASFTYDDDGYLRTKTVGGETTTYTYSSRGELLQVDLPDGTVVEYVHDPLGRRIAKKVNGAYTEHYLWAGMTTLLAVYDGSGVLKQRFEYAAGRLPVRMVEGGAAYHLVYDQVGTLRAVVDGSGNVVRTIEYDSFGNIIEDSDPSLSIPFGFAGGLYDVDTGLVKLGARDYDSDVGRWTSKDPIAFDGGDTDLYGYCMGDPVGAFDPDGLMKVILYDDDFSSQAKALKKHWKRDNKHEDVKMFHVESYQEFLDDLKCLAGECFTSSITEMVLMFHSINAFSDFFGMGFTFGEDLDLSYLSTVDIPGENYGLISELPYLPFANDAIIKLNVCKGALGNIAEAFRDRYGVTVWAYKKNVNYRPNWPFLDFHWQPVERGRYGGLLTPEVYTP